MSPIALTISQFTVSFVIVATLALVLWLIKDFITKRGTISGETYLYIKPSDTDYFDMITEFRNDIPRK